MIILGALRRIRLRIEKDKLLDDEMCMSEMCSKSVLVRISDDEESILKVALYRKFNELFEPWGKDE